MAYNSSMTQNPGETQDQTAARYQADYWAPDRAAVLGGTQGQPNQAGQPAAPQNAFPTPPPQGGAPGAAGQPNSPNTGNSAFPNQTGEAMGPASGAAGASNIDPYTGQPGADPATLANHQALWAAGIAQGRTPQDLQTTTPDQLAYWDQKIQATGGLSDYWKGRMADKPGQGTNAGGGSAAGGGAYIPGQGVAGQGSIFTAQGGTPAANSLEAILMQRAGENIIPSASDPIIKTQTDAFRAQQDQAARQGLSQAAERVGGANTATLDAESRSASEQAGQATSQFEGQAMQRELDARRQEVQAALSGAQGMLTADEQMQLQEELAQLQLAQQANQFQTNQNNVVNNLPPA